MKKLLYAPLILLIICILLLVGCSVHRISSFKHITYNNESKMGLDVYKPKKLKGSKEVLVFIHGGNWNSGNKNMYRFFGKGMARKGIVSVVIDYRLSPFSTYDVMAMDAAKAVKWVKENIATYGGDSSKIFVSGHSAGGHLAALIATDETYFNALKINNPIHGVVLIDAFGLDMYKYLTISRAPKDAMYLPVFSKDPATWKKGSPANYLHQGMPPFLIFLGERTHHSIIFGSYDFLGSIRKFQPDAQLIVVKKKKHIPMIVQFINPYNKAYKQILEFIHK